MRIKTLPLLAALCFVLASAVSHAQTTYTLGDGPCHIGWVDCVSVPVLSDGVPVSSSTIFLAPYQGPYAEDFIEGIPGFKNGWAEAVNDSTYHITYATVRNPNGTPAQVPATITFELIQIIVTGDYTTTVGSLTGTMTINFGGYYYTTGRFNTGWHWSVVGGMIVVNQ